MMKQEDIQTIFFLGIGGIGMSALARYFHSRGIRVCGYDRTPSALTKELEEEGMEIVFGDDRLSPYAGRAGGERHIHVSAGAGI